jgi:hypothetical protein
VSEHPADEPPGRAEREGAREPSEKEDHAGSMAGLVRDGMKRAQRTQQVAGHRELAKPDLFFTGG